MATAQVRRNSFGTRFCRLGCASSRSARQPLALHEEQCWDTAVTTQSVKVIPQDASLLPLDKNLWILIKKQVKRILLITGLQIYTLFYKFQ